MDSTDNHRKMAEKRAEVGRTAGAENSQPRKPGSAAFRSQGCVSRSLGSDPLVRSTVTDHPMNGIRKPKARK
jgi:hypothetical protein